MCYKIIAMNSSNVPIEFAVDKKEVTFPTFEEAEQFAHHIKKMNHWFEDYKFSVVKEDNEN
ncbi:hypothetical protein [Halobacillus sp. Marseille-Q1614]|uniref:hypothetical protein n=1 Tax=Halobacillus sp. Marseille-Q1614 TaxID=2709134 RepID=UPI00156F7D04|nr:hypothetical protein [Halobacillus sp. Marseille-Q1614]